MRINQRRLILVGLIAVALIILLFVIVSCLIKPDTTIDNAPIDPSGAVLPFETATPSPSPDISLATDGQNWETWNSEVPAVITPAPTPTTAPTIQVITASPKPMPSWTPTPVPTKRPDDGTLRNGASGQNVRQLQQRLKDLGYYTGSVDGDFGDGTETALREFQRENGLTVDGVAGKATLAAINSNSAIANTAASRYATSRPTPLTYSPYTFTTYRYLQIGSSGSDVTRLQTRLKELGYFNGNVNGQFGADTEAAVLAFQKRNGIWADAVAGEQTQRMLFSSAALANGGYVPASTMAVGSRTLKNGMTGDDVLQLQTRLNELYYYNGSLNGAYNSATELAIRVFQQRNGLNVDGAAGMETQAKLYSASAIYAPTAQPTATAFKASGTLQLGSMGEEVFRLQERLYDLGYYTGKVDGAYSDAVVQAVRAFQTANKLTADGKAGSSTQKLVFSASAIPAASTNNTYQSIREGMQGDDVRALQVLLSTYGYFTDPVDGIYGATTVTAVQQLQSINGLSSDGVAGPATLQLLYQGAPKRMPAVTSPPATQYAALKQGMTGMDVMQMQQYLQDYGYFGYPVDGSFGATTFIAVQAFQKKNELKADGIAGQETLTLLYSGNGIKADGYGQTQQTTPQRTSMKQGDEGQDVFNLQSRLNTLGYFTGLPDGKYSTTTTAAVKAFQAKNKLQADGVAGQATMTMLYAAGVVANTSSQNQTPGSIVDNRNRELEEQQASGAIQGSLAGGGVAASYNSTVYYAGGTNGALYAGGAGNERKLYDSPASFIHASSNGITFVSGSKILRMPIGGVEPQTLVQAGGIEKLSVVGDTLYYLEGNSLVRASTNGDPTVIASGVNDFTLDIYQMTAYYATSTGIRRIGLNGANDTIVASTNASQVQLCDSVLFFRSGGSIYRDQEGISVLLMDAAATWMGIYRNKIYYIAGDRLYRCDTSGQNSVVFYDGVTANVSFVAGKVYITQTKGGPVTQILAVE